MLIDYIETDLYASWCPSQSQNSLLNDFSKAETCLIGEQDSFSNWLKC